MSKDMDLKELIEFASAQAEKIFRKAGEFVPMWHAITAEGREIIVVSPEFCEHKDAGIQAIREQFEKEDVEIYVFISEAWLLETKRSHDRQDLAKIARQGIGNHPDRREVIAFSAENRKGEMLTGRRYILRPEHGKAKLSPLMLDDMQKLTESSGRMVGLLKRRSL